MKKAFCVLALSACFFACQKQQANDKRRAGREREAELSARERALIESKQKTVSQLKPVSVQQVEQEPANGEQPAEEIGNTPTPANIAPPPTPVGSITPQPEASVTPTATETPILSPTPTISSTPESTVQTSEIVPVATSRPRLRLNPLATGTPFPEASVSPTAVHENRSQVQEAVKSWIRSASGKKRAKPSASPSSSPPQ
jgi:hypothetical protein